MTPAEQLSLTLQDLYSSFGYRQFKVSRFEEYDLYAQYKRFLASPQILTFTDLNGRLMALKPDVTLSIIRNTRFDEFTQKVWYTENVYRIPHNGGGFQEIMQTGLEHIGLVDLYAMGEVVMLAARSLEAIGGRWVLELSHMGILTGVLDALGLSPIVCGDLIAALREKNAHDLTAVCAREGIDGAPRRMLTTLCRLSGPAREVLASLSALSLPAASQEAVGELRQLCSLLDAFGACNVQIDMSVADDTDYYNGVLFRGYVDGVATAVLSGGRYDNLLHRMGRSGGAIGFAVYLNELQRLLFQPPDRDVDTLLVYTPEDDPAAVAAAARRETEQGRTVRVQPAGESGVTYGRRISPDGKEV